MKRLLVISLLLATVFPAAGQHVQAAMRKAKEREEAMARRILMDEGGSGRSGYLSYRVMDGDTMYFDNIDPVWIFSRKQQKDWKKYYKLVYNFARVYPYAQASGRLQEIVDSTIAANNYGRMKKDHRPGNRTVVLLHHPRLQERDCRRLLARHRQALRQRPQVRV